MQRVRTTAMLCSRNNKRRLAMHYRLRTTVTALALILGISIQATADTSAEDAFKYRKTFMTSLRGHAGAISMQVRGLAGDSDYIVKHAKAMANLGSELHSVFPEGSAVEDSEALPEIWAKPDEFAAAVAKAADAMTALGEIAEGGDMQAIGKAFGSVGKTCKGCHESFREEHEH